MLEGRERAGAVVVEVAMIAVVKAKNIAGPARAGVLRGVPLSVSGDGLHAVDEPFGGPLQPIARDERPHRGLAAELTRGRDDPRIAKAIRRAEPFCGRAESVRNGVVAETQFDSDLRRAEPSEIPMRIGVVADDVATRGSLFDEVRAFADEAANHEKRGFGLVAVQQIEHLRRDGGIGAVVKRDSQFAGRIGAANRWAKKLRAGIHRAVSGNASGHNHGRRHRN